MMKHLLLTLLLLAGAQLYCQSLASVYFDTDRAELSPEAQKALDVMVPELLQSADYHIYIEAYADDRGTVEYNRQLAARRAAAVQEYLAGKGVFAEKSSVTNWGEAKSDDISDAGRQRYRRVDLRLSPVFFNTVSEVQQRLASNNTQTLKIQATEEKEIVAAKGTVVRVPAGAFVFEDGSVPSGEIEITVKEALDPADFILNNLSTTSGGRILQSGGMVYIEASADGKPLRIAEGQSIAVSVPNKREFDPSMQLFYAGADQNGNLDWNPAGQKLEKGYGTFAGIWIPVDPSVRQRIAKITVPQITEPEMPVFRGNIPVRPIKPRQPGQPRAPRKPDWNEVQKIFGVQQDNNPKKLKKAKAYYQERLQLFARDSANYVVLEEKYHQNLERYQQQQVQYAQDFKAWKTEFTRRARACQEYEWQMRRHLYLNCLANAVKVKASTLKRYSPNSDLSAQIEAFATNQMNQVMLGTSSFTELIKKNRKSHTALQRALGNDPYNDENVKDCPDAFRLMSEDYVTFKDEVINKIGIKEIQKELELAVAAKLKTMPPSSMLVDQRLNDYVARVTQTGWFNCDRFLSTDNQETVQVQESENSSVYVVSLSDKIMANCLRNPLGVFCSPSMPRGMRVAVVSIKVVDGKAQYARRDVMVGAPVLSPMEYKTMTMKEMREELNKLNI